MNLVLLLTHTPLEKRPLPKARPMRRTARTGQLPRTRLRSRDRVDVGSLSHAPHEDPGPADPANAKRRLDCHSRWHGLAEPHLQIWKAL